VLLSTSTVCNGLQRPPACFECSDQHVNQQRGKRSGKFLPYDLVLASPARLSAIHHMTDTMLSSVKTFLSLLRTCFRSDCTLARLRNASSHAGDVASGEPTKPLTHICSDAL
jgi:hypothetical protein